MKKADYLTKIFNETCYEGRRKRCIDFLLSHTNSQITEIAKSLGITIPRGNKNSRATWIYKKLENEEGYNILRNI